MELISRLIEKKVSIKNKLDNDFRRFVAIVHPCPTVPSSWRHAAKLHKQLPLSHGQEVPKWHYESVHNSSSAGPNPTLEQRCRWLLARNLRLFPRHSHACCWHRFNTDAWYHSTISGETQRVSIPLPFSEVSIFLIL